MHGVPTTQCQQMTRPLAERASSPLLGVGTRAWVAQALHMGAWAGELQHLHHVGYMAWVLDWTKLHSEFAPYSNVSPTQRGTRTPTPTTTRHHGQQRGRKTECT